MHDCYPLMDKILNTPTSLHYNHDLSCWPLLCASPQIASFLGYSTEQVSQMSPEHLENLICPADKDAVRQYQKKFTSHTIEEEVFSIEYRMRHLNGEWCWLQARHGVCEKKPNNTVLRICCFVQDINKEKRFENEHILEGCVASLMDHAVQMGDRYRGAQSAQDALLESHRLLDDIIDGSPALILVKDIEGRFLLANRRFEEHMGRTREQLFGKTDYDFCTKDKAEYYRANDKRALTQGHLMQFEEESNTKDGGRQIFLTNKFPLINAAGKAYAVCGISTDITYLKKIEDELIEAKLTAEFASKAKSQFLANMSHELRTPMNAIMGMTELLCMTKLDDTQQKYLSYVKSGSKLLLGLINDILDLSKIEAGYLRLYEKEFEISSFVNENMALYQGILREKQLVFRCDIDDDIPARVIGDPLRLSQIIGNLLSNAVKFTASGQVSLHVSSEKQKGGGMTLSFAVTDTGIGIPKDRLGGLFIYFSQLDQSITRKYGGSGLGLAISRSLAKAMGGDISVESEPGKGSTFCLKISVRLPDTSNTCNQPKTKAYFQNQTKEEEL